MAKLSRTAMRNLRHRRVRRDLSGTAERPRMSVCVSSKQIYVQFIDDERGVTLASASSLDPEFRSRAAKTDVAGAAVLGALCAERARAQSIEQVVFDRGGSRYHGRVRAVADAAREGGLKF